MAESSYVLGLDPGLNGAWCVLDSAHAYVRSGIMPVQKATADSLEGVNIVSLRNQIYMATFGCRPVRTVIEHVTPFAGASRQSCFTFGRSFQALLDVCAMEGWPYQLVFPVTWKVAILGINSKDKLIAIDWCNRTFPTSAPVTHDGIADATCIAEYAYRTSYGVL